VTASATPTAQAPQPAVVLVAAVARNGVIGRAGGLAWNIPEDMAHFKAVTAGGTVIMGRSTWESIPQRFRPLPGRRNIVLSRQPGFASAGAEVVPTVEAAFALAASPRNGQAAPSAVFVIGGAQIYTAVLAQATRLELTELQQDFEGDAHFPAGWQLDFLETGRRRVTAAAPNNFDIDFVTYERRV
jgi:dihydrofolate reductase